VKDAGVWPSDTRVVQVLKAETIQEVLVKMKERWEGTKGTKKHGNGTVKKVRCTDMSHTCICEHMYRYSNIYKNM